MGESGSPVLFSIFIFATLFSVSSVFARAVPEVPKTSVFNVSASIQRTVDILSFNPETLQQQEAEESAQKTSSSSFILKLYSQDTFRKTPFKNYRELAISRLKRDSARVKYLYKKLNPSLKEDDVTSGFLPMDLEAPVTAGSGEYLARVGFGTPPVLLYTSIDTGSDLTWIQCEPCEQCYTQTDPIFDPTMSSSYKPLGSGYRITYGDKSFTQGEIASETLVLGNSLPITDIAIGCGHDNEGIFAQDAAGLFGLGRGQISFPSQIKSSVFSYCLVDKDSGRVSTLEFGSSSLGTDGVTTPLLPNSQYPSFYYVGLTGISVNGQKLPISSSMFAIDQSGSGGVIVDSGTVVTRFLPELYNQIRDGFVQGTTGLTPFGGFSIFDTCYDLASKSIMDFPSVAFHFDAVTLSLPAKNVMIPVGDNIFCFAFAPASGRTSIIGNFQQQGFGISYDEDRSQVGFSPDKC